MDDGIGRRRRESEAGAADVVYVFSTVTWQAAAKRGGFASEDRLVRSLLATKRVGRLIICNHFRSRPRKLARDLLEREKIPFPSDERTMLVEPVRWRRRDPVSIVGVQRESAAYDRALAGAARQLGMRDPVVISGHPLVAGFADLAWARAVTWYAIDDWAAHPAYRPWWDAYRESYDRVRVRGRRVAAVSSVLLERLAPTGPSAVVPNGLDPDEWLGETTPPDWLPGLSRPVLVYAGSLDLRLDIEWLSHLAREMPAGTIVLVGAIVDEAHLAPLRVAPNVQIRPPLDRGPLTGLIRGADVGLLPHRRNALTEAMSPLKLFEYLAAGLPVAATDLPPIRRIDHPRVVLAAPGGDFTDACRRALELGRAPDSERLRFIEANSWQVRHDQLLDLALA